MVLLRSLLFVPGNRSDMLEKSQGLTVDAIVPDMEDSVPISEKFHARELVSQSLPSLVRDNRFVIPRTNALGTGLLEDDLAAVVTPFIFGVTVGKIDSLWHVRQVESIIAKLELRAGIPVGQIRLIPWIETAQGIMNVKEICGGSSRIVAVAFGGEDFTADMSIQRTDIGAEILYPRSLVAIAAKSFGIGSLDTPYVSFRDQEGLRNDALLARSLGFTGKFAIHPNQLETIDSVFSPDPREVDYAKKIVQTFEKAETEGKGATSLDGKMIDIPVVHRARNLLAQVDAIEKSKGNPKHS